MTIFKNLVLASAALTVAVKYSFAPILPTLATRDGDKSAINLGD